LKKLFSIFKGQKSWHHKKLAPLIIAKCLILCLPRGGITCPPQTETANIIINSTIIFYTRPFSRLAILTISLSNSRLDISIVLSTKQCDCESDSVLTNSAFLRSRSRSGTHFLTNS